MSESDLNFCLFYIDDGYSMQGKIMGRQSAGNGLLKGVARRWQTAEIGGVGLSRRAGEQMLAQLRTVGHGGAVRWHDLSRGSVPRPGAVYYPAPPDINIAHHRNAGGPARYSLFGLTHTLASTGAMDQVAKLILPPFQPWDALICTSRAAHGIVRRLQDELRDWMNRHLAVTRFNDIQTPVIPLGINAPAYKVTQGERVAARQTLGLDAGEVAFLFAGRLTFHGKANPAPFYQAVEAACRHLRRPLVIIEAGIYPNENIRRAFDQARKTLAPSARFIPVDGSNAQRYQAASRAADVFISLSDNIQETFGLTPLEAMAAGLPVLVSDWDGYKDSVRDGIDGYRIPTLMPPEGTGRTIEERYALGADTYDYHIGRVSLATAVNAAVLTDRIIALAADPNLRRRLGEAGRQRAQDEFDWSIVLDRYVALADKLHQIRQAATAAATPWPSRPDPFALFSHYPTASVQLDWTASLQSAPPIALRDLFELEVARYGFEPGVLTRAAVEATHYALARGEQTVGQLLTLWPGDREQHLLALMWLVKFGLVLVRP